MKTQQCAGQVRVLAHPDDGAEQEREGKDAFLDGGGGGGGGVVPRSYTYSKIGSRFLH